MTTTTALIVCIGLFTLYLFKRLLTSDRGGPPLPPGPSRWPLIGNLLDWPQSKDWITFTKWAEAYGDIVHADVAGTHMIILNSAELAYALLDEKSSIYSERPAPYVLSKLIGWESSLSCMDQGHPFRETRRLIQQEIGSHDALAKYHSILEIEIRRFLLHFIDNSSSDQLKTKMRRLASAFVSRLLYGWETTYEDDDDLFQLTDRVNRDISAAIRPGAFLVDYIRSIELLPHWFPGMGYRKTLKQMHDNLIEFVESPFKFVQSNIASGTASQSFISHYLMESKMNSAQEEILKWTGGALRSGGTDTIGSPFYTFFLVMTLYPGVQAKARAEIDTVVGSGRLPSIKDRDQLPYVDALVKELYRWGSVGPAGLAHRALQNDFHDGYWIPKDSIVIANIWRFTRDPRTYVNPDIFEPSRFLGPMPERDPRKLVFGFGRRVCPGEVFADASIFLVCASILATFNIQTAQDPTTGELLEPEVDFVGVTATAPKEFPTSITPRSARTEELIRNAVIA